MKKENNKEATKQQLVLTDKQIERFYDTLVKIFEDKYDVKIDYTLKKV